jgi:hypothetical protein
MTIQDLPGHKYLRNTMTLRHTCTCVRCKCRSGQVYTYTVDRAAVCSPQDCIDPGIKHTAIGSIG